MSFTRSLCRFVAALAFSLCAVGSSHATISYHVSLQHPEQHTFRVTMTIPNVTGKVTVQIPAWNALYQVRDFSVHLEQVEAFAGSEKAPIEKVDKQTWQISGNGTIEVRYATYWNEPGPFGTQLSAEHAFINPAMILMYVPQRRAEEVQLTVSDAPNAWKSASAALPSSVATNPAARFELSAPSYDVLADAPIEISKFEDLEIPGLNPPVYAVVHADKWNPQELKEELRRICAYEVKLMDGAPYNQYLFLIHLGKLATGIGGGMEHSNSTAISVRSESDFPNVAAHEFFHLWNVKRIRPASLEPVDYTKEQYTRALWFAEGVTSTYAAYTLVRTHLWSAEQFDQDFSEQITELENRPGNRWISAEQSSLDAWLEKYPLHNRPAHGVSYYTKGQILGVLLDILIRDRTDNQRSLDDVMRAMNAEFAKQGRTYRDSLDVRLTAEKVAGGSFEDFFRRYVSGAESLPYQEVLRLAGWDLRASEYKRATLGFDAERDATGTLVVRSVDSDGGAAVAGLRVGDVVQKWNESEPPRSLARWLYSQRPGDTLHLQVTREEGPAALTLKLGETAQTFYRITDQAHPSEKAGRIREGILRGMTQPVMTSVH